jgi:hypothetical protein
MENKMIELLQSNIAPLMQRTMNLMNSVTEIESTQLGFRKQVHEAIAEIGRANKLIEEFRKFDKKCMLIEKKNKMMSDEMKDQNSKYDHQLNEIYNDL